MNLRSMTIIAVVFLLSGCTVNGGELDLDPAVTPKINNTIIEELPSSVENQTTPDAEVDPDVDFIKIENSIIEDALKEGLKGQIIIPKIDLETDIYYVSDQSLIDEDPSLVENLAGSSPVGTHFLFPSVVAAHNNIGAFGRLGELEIGDKIYFDLDYGQFIYEVYDMTTGYDEDGELTFNDQSIYTLTDFNTIVLYTCYPFDVIETDERYLVFAKFIDGTEVDHTGVNDLLAKYLKALP